MTRTQSKQSVKASGKPQAQQPRQRATRSKASKHTSKTTMAEHTDDGSTNSQPHLTPKETENQQDHAQVIDLEGKTKEIKREGQFSIEDQALSVLRDTMNNPGNSVGHRNDAAAKILQVMKGKEGNNQPVQRLTRDQLQAEIMATKQALIANGLF